MINTNPQPTKLVATFFKRKKLEKETSSGQKNESLQKRTDSSHYFGVKKIENFIQIDRLKLCLLGHLEA